MANLLNKFIMTRILAAITLLLSIVLTILVTIFCSAPIIIAGIVKLLLPVPVIWRKVSRFCDFMMYCWCEGLAVLLHLNPHLQWEVHGLEGLSKKNWYLLICNHRSWADIVVTTRRSCKKFRLHPTTIVNFVEGSRFTQEKHQQTHSTFQNLLPPKAAGIAMALNVLGKQFDKLLNVTLCYPDNNRQPFFDMLSGKLTRIVVHVDLQPIADELHGDYINDKSFKRHFQQWLNSLWQEKDRLLTSLMSSQRQEK